jgi:predicted SnoaL-like aldol condensation-catalyzing enzyme
MPAHLLTTALALALAATAVSAATPTEAANKRLVLAMWKGVIDEADEAAVMRYIAPDYIQHNTRLANGRAALLEGVRRLRHPQSGDPPHRKKTLVSAVAEGDLVVLVWTRDEVEGGRTVRRNLFDMFRIEDGLVAEHWDDAAEAR